MEPKVRVEYDKENRFSYVCVNQTFRTARRQPINEFIGDRCFMRLNTFNESRA